MPVVSIDGFESLVVYKVALLFYYYYYSLDLYSHYFDIKEDEEGATTGKVHRKIVQGPCQFVPDAHEWVHEFSWSQPPLLSEPSAASSAQPSRKFTKLKTIPEQVPITCKVRTNNDVVLLASVMLVCECVDVERMLVCTDNNFSLIVYLKLLGFHWGSHWRHCQFRFS